VVAGTELIALIEAGSGLVVGTVGADGEPRAIRAWGASLLDEAGQRVRVVMSGDDPVTTTNLAATGTIALTAADVRTFRSVQFKGRVVATSAPTPADLELAARGTEAFFRAVNETDGDPLEQLQRLLPHAMLAVEFVVDEVYDQTPGPRAGTPVPQGSP
jgi:hypothetical protein